MATRRRRTGRWAGWVVAVAVGWSALGGGPAGAGDFTDTALGVAALPNDTTGVGNTAVGYGALFSDDTGNYNTALGAHTLSSTTSGSENTAVGVNALYSNHSSFNTAVGVNALVFNDAGDRNTAVGHSALLHNMGGIGNTAVGVSALFNNSGGSNTAVGFDALLQNVNGSNNIALGNGAGLSLTGSNNIAIGNQGVATDGTDAMHPAAIRIGAGQGQTFIAGITGVTVSGAQVLVDGNGQLGVAAASSRRVKDEIREMGAASRGLMRLRPVTFRYVEPLSDGTRPRQYGLIAEEVAEVYPELVARTAAGEPWTVLYHELPAMLLNEWQQQAREQGRQAEAVQQQARELAALRAENAVLRTHQAETGEALARQAAQIELLTGQLATLAARLGPHEAAARAQGPVTTE